MEFMFKRIFQKLRSNFRIYSLIVLQIAIAILILNVSLILSVNSDKKLERLLEENKNEEFHILVKDMNASLYDYSENSIDDNFTESNYEAIPFSTEDLDELSKVLSNIDWKIEVVLNINFLLKDNTIESIGAVYTTGTKEVFMNENTYNILCNVIKTININDFPYEIKEDKLVALDGKEYQVNIQNSNDSNIYLPYELYYKLYNPSHLFDTRLTIVLKDFSFDNGDILIKAQTLLSSNSNFIYYLNNEFYDMLRSLHSVAEENTVIRFISYILLIITTIGLTGVFILIINERKKEVAINLALGSSKKRVCIECYIELMMLALTGCTLGLSSNIIFGIKDLNYINVSLRPNPYVIIVQLIIICGIVMISMIPVIKTVTMLTPMEILRVE
ncbi:FtsX-like permease family protein [Clostridium sp. Marseille-P299]|uniref:FtsX-like permease family protein n=1 Tax=Clostridium sp. Marseille-P299 TaxID=1805477 RepID=UPI0008331351|nr:FtsX-like permease family protein [Clostridium sp. Marseille-P299]